MSNEKLSYEWLWTEHYQTERNNIYDVSMIILEILWTSSEQYFMDYHILLIFEFTSRLGRCEWNKSIYLTRG